MQVDCPLSLHCQDSWIITTAIVVLWKALELRSHRLLLPLILTRAPVTLIKSRRRYRVHERRRYKPRIPEPLKSILREFIKLKDSLAWEMYFSLSCSRYMEVLIKVRIPPRTVILPVSLYCNFTCTDDIGSRINGRPITMVRLYKCLPLSRFLVHRTSLLANQN